MVDASFGESAAAAIEHIFDCVSGGELIIHVVGGDAAHEGKAPKELWGQVAARALLLGYTKISIFVVGPGMARDEYFEIRADSSVQLVSALYHEWFSDQKKPSLYIFFHPGLWGYDGWESTLRILPEKSPCLFTSYTLEEAFLDAREICRVLLNHSFLRDEDEEEHLADLFASSSSCWIWPPEINPYRSLELRPTVSAPSGHEYRENGAWQCIRVPGFGLR